MVIACKFSAYHIHAFLTGRTPTHIHISSSSWSTCHRIVGFVAVTAECARIRRTATPVEELFPAAVARNIILENKTLGVVARVRVR